MKLSRPMFWYHLIKRCMYSLKFDAYLYLTVYLSEKLSHVTHIKSYHLWSWIHYRPICFVTYLSKCMKVRWIKKCHVLMIECNSFKLPGLHSVKTLSLSISISPLSLFLCTSHISHSVSVCLSLAFIFSHLFFTPRSFNAFIFFTRVLITCNKIPGFEY